MIVVTQSAARGGRTYVANEALNYVKELVKTISSTNRQNLAFDAVSSLRNFPIDCGNRYRWKSNDGYWSYNILHSHICDSLYKPAILPFQ